MTLSGEFPNSGISPHTEQLLRYVFSEIPPGQNLSQSRFSDDQISSEVDELNDTGIDGPFYPWKTYFSPKNGDWILDTETIAKHWCVTLQETHPVEIVDFETMTESPGSYRVTIKSGKRGNFEFLLFFDSESLLKASPKLSESTFLVGFILPATDDDRDGVFSWFEMLESDFWDELVGLIIQHQRPPDQTVCELGSPAIERNYDGVKDSFRAFGKSADYEVKEQPQLIRNIQRADEELPLEKIDFAIEIDAQTHLTACDCENTGANTFHSHLVEDGTLMPPEKNNNASKIVKNSHDKVRKYNSYVNEIESSGTFVRLIGVLLTLGALPALNGILQLINANQQDPIQDFYVIIGIVLLTIGIGLLLYTIWPLIQLRRFSWD